MTKPSRDASLVQIAFCQRERLGDQQISARPGTGLAHVILTTRANEQRCR
jgi:hypothetical protein